MPLIERSNSVLVVVDTQPGFAEQDALGAAAVDRAAWLAAVATKIDIPAVVVEEEPDENGPTEPLAPRTPSRRHAGDHQTDVRARRVSRGPGGDPGDRGGTPVLVGFETDVCVSQSAIALHDLGFRTVVVEDAADSGTELQHQRGLARMRQLGVEITHCKGLAYEWLRTVDFAARIIEAVGERPQGL